MMTETSESTSRVAGSQSACLDFVSKQLERDLAPSERDLASSAVDFNFNGNSVDYDETNATFQPGKRLSTADRQVIEQVVRFLGSIPAESDNEKTRRGRIARVAFVVDE